MAKPNPAWLDAAFDVGHIVFVFSAMAGVVVLGWQGFTWLRLGDWPEMPIGNYLPIDLEGVQWIGLRRILAFLLDLPLAGTLICGPFLVGVALLTIYEQFNPD